MISSNIVYSQLKALPKNEHPKGTAVQPSPLPMDVWKVIFNNLDFNDWKNLLSTHWSFKRICEDPVIMNSLLKREKCIPDTKKVSFAIKLGPNLRELDLHKIFLTEQELMKIFACTHLQELDLGYIKRQSPPLKEELATMMQTISSFVTCCRKTKKTPQKYPPLTKLDLSRFPYSKQKIIEILTSCPNLTALNLSHCQLTDEILKYLPETLHSLCLSHCEITDENLQLLRRFVNLKILDLSFCEKITNKGLKQLQLLDSLKELYLMECKQINEVGHAYLKPSVSIKLSLNPNWREYPNTKRDIVAERLELLLSLPPFAV